MATESKIAELRPVYKKHSDDMLRSIKSNNEHFYAEHIVADAELCERKEATDRRRFHLIFWPALVGAIATILSLVFQASQTDKSNSVVQQTATKLQPSTSQTPAKINLVP
jgi:hypothetical protein